ncbi:MAG: exodeoxyribonuclease V subunit gamma [Pseudomonadota bacterium]
MLNVFHSNRLDVLAKHLASALKNSHLTDPMCPLNFVVQSAGMATWLKTQIAEEVGIAGNLNFQLPSAWSWQIFNALTQTTTDSSESAYSLLGMQWRLFTLLPQLLDDGKFQPLQRYLNTLNSPAALFSLAGEIASVFDQYSVYRPDWLTSWEQQEVDIENKGIQTTPEQSHSQWQKQLWLALKNKALLENKAHFNRVHLLDILQTIDFTASPYAERLAKYSQAPVFIFGLSTLPLRLMEIIRWFAQFTSIHFYQLNPCQEYWGDLISTKALAFKNLNLSREKKEIEATYYESGHPLLTSLGQQGKEFLEHLLENDVAIHDLFVPPPANNLLQHLQTQLLHNEIHGNKKPIKEDDQSIRIHACYHPLREMHVLKDFLLQQITEKHIEPHQIVVMIPNLENYIPFIHAIFGQSSIKNNLPYSISDQSFKDANHLAPIFLSLLQLRLSRFNFSDITSLLNIPAIRDALQLSSETCQAAIDKLYQYGARWGLNQEHQVSHVGSSAPSACWDNAIKNFYNDYVFAPHLSDSSNVIDDSSILEATGILIAFIDKLQNLATFSQESHTIKEWLVFIDEALLTLFHEELPETQALEQQISQASHELLNIVENLYFEATPMHQVAVDVDILHQYLEKHFLQHKQTHRFLTGAINFCTLVPMRTIPFKVVCLLGLNERDFPRQDQPHSFDLIHYNQRRRGDRSKRDDDLYLFLESIIAAQDVLHLSYVGFDSQDGRALAPSSVINELKESVYQNYYYENQKNKNPEDWLTEFHPLHPFHKDYFTPSSTLYTYSTYWEACAMENQKYLDTLSKQQQATIVPAPLETVTSDIRIRFSELPLHDFIQFFIHPTRFFFNRCLGVNFDIHYQEQANHELFSQNSLERYLFNQDFLKYQLENPNIEEWLPTLKQQHGIPEIPLGDWIVDQNHQSTSTIYHHLRQQVSAALTPLTIDLHCQDIHLQGNIANTVEDTLYYHYLSARLSAKHLITAWFYHLFAATTKQLRTTKIIGQQKKIASFKPLNADDSLAILNQMIKLFKDGTKMPLPFALNSGYAFYQQKNHPESALKAFNQSWYGGYTAGEADDPYLSRVCPELSPQDVSFQQVCNILFEPLMQHFIK